MSVTYDKLKEMIKDEPILITSDGDEVTAISCNETGVVCEDEEDEEGERNYAYDDLELQNTKLTKRQLINMLEESDLKDDDLVVIWNGLVDDYMHIYANIVVKDLYREKMSHIRNGVLYDLFQGSGKLEENLTEKEIEEVNTKTKKIYDEYNEYDTPNPFVEEHRFYDWYEDTPQKIGLLQALNRGKKECDRGGCIEY